MSIQSINARNQFRGKIKEIILGPVVSEVDVDTPAGIVTSVITTRSVKELDLQVGTECWPSSRPPRSRSPSCNAGPVGPGLSCLTPKLALARRRFRDILSSRYPAVPPCL